MSEVINANVLIVGSGPAGMTTALALAKFGISSILIDCRKTIYMEPRAHALNSRTLEIFSALDIDIADLKAVAAPIEESCWVRWVDTLSGGEYGKLPYERMHMDEDLPTPWPLFNIAQPAAEKVMQAYVDKEGAIQTLRPWQWKSCEHSAEGVLSIVIDDRGRKHQILSRYLVGADGAGSPVRQSQAIEMKGMGIVHDFIMIHFKADLSEVVRESPAILYWVMRQECSGTFIAFDAKNSWVFMYPYDDADTDKSVFTDEYCRQLVLKAIGRSDIEVEILSNGGWVLGSQIAESYRKQNVFLVGDSAHRYPPSGGLGLNTGVGDAHNLAWKMAAVLQDWAWPELLDSYHSERERVAQINASFSADNAGKLFSIMLATGSLLPAGMQPSFDELRGNAEAWVEIEQGIEGQRDHFDGLALHIGQHYGRKNAPDLRAENFQFSDVGARFPHAWLMIEGQRASSLEVLSANKITLIARVGVDIPSVNSEVPFQVKTQSTHFFADSDALKTMGLDDAAVIIVRPDGHIAARIMEASVTADSLKHALHKVVAKFTRFD